MIARVGNFAYQLALPPNLDKVHNVFYISIFKKYTWDEEHIIKKYKELNIQSDVTYEVELAILLDKQNKVPRRNMKSLVKVLWKDQGHEKASWEKKSDWRKEYPHLFQDEEQSNLNSCNYFILNDFLL